jgi:hypothetical protein
MIIMILQRLRKKIKASIKEIMIESQAFCHVIKCVEMDGYLERRDFLTDLVNWR